MRPPVRRTTGALPAQPASLVGRAGDLALARGLLMRGLMGEAHQHLGRALTIEQVPPTVRARLLNGAALVAYDRGEYAEATALAEEALGLCRREGDARGAAFARSSLGFVAYFQGDYDRAATSLQRGLALARASGDGTARDGWRWRSGTTRRPRHCFRRA